MADFRKKRSDTKIGTIEKKYGRDFGVRSDKELGTVLKETGFASLTKLLKASDAKRTTKKSSSR
jgi:hypothetical protein